MKYSQQISVFCTNMQNKRQNSSILRAADLHMNKQRVRQLCTATAHTTRAAINASTLSKFSEKSDSWNPVFLFHNNVLHVIFHSPMI